MRPTTQATAIAALAVAAVGLVLASGAAAGRILVGHAGVGLLLGVAGALAVPYAFGRELTAHVVGEPPLTLTRTDVGFLLSILVAAPLTRLVAQTGAGVVVGSGIVGLLAHLFVQRYEASAYCGTFVGMAAMSVLSWPELMVASLIAGVVFIAVQRAFNGFGGKLGTTAFVGCGVAALASGSGPDAVAVPSVAVAAGSLAAATVGAVGAYRLARLRGLGPVFGSSVVGIVAGGVALVLPGTTLLAAAAFCGSFTGMSHSGRLPSVASVALAGVVTGLLFTAAVPVLAGFGGKLGTVAFVSCLVTHTLLAVAGGRLGVSEEFGFQPLDG
ncbi:MAG: hypothetical protein U5K28_09340 [Halobacteriales archaeon]|nr:hypothetical protein [Halobacteriales archaeon]